MPPQKKIIIQTDDMLKINCRICHKQLLKVNDFDVATVVNTLRAYCEICDDLRSDA